MTLASQGANAQMAMDAVGIGAGSEPFEFVSESLRRTSTILDSSGIRGTRSHIRERTRAGSHEIGGSIVLNLSPADLDRLLPRILGGGEVADVFSLTEDLPSFHIAIDRVAGVFTYESCYVQRAILRAVAGGLIQLELVILGTTETLAAAGTFPVLVFGDDETNAPYVLSDATLTLLGVPRQMMSFELVIDNALDRRFTNSQTATSITPQDRVISLTTNNPFTSAELDLYTQDSTGSAGTLTFTNGSLSTTFSFASLQAAARSPVVPGKQEIPLTLEMIARKTNDTDELIVTNISSI
jgi:hypothetical protein